MSYCVNCGVELANTEKNCPLCHTPVLNPANPYREPPVGAYPKRVEYIMTSVNRRYGALLFTILLAIPIVCCLLIDLLFSGSVTWSGFVAGGCICIFVWFLMPQILKKRNVWLEVLYDTAALSLYLADIFAIIGSIRSYLLFALPLVLAACALTYSIVPIALSKSLRNNLAKIAIPTFEFAAFLVIVEIIIDLNIYGRLELIWSTIAAVPLTVTGLLLLFLEKKKKVKDRILRRLFV